jgi:hypothetical protein
VCARARARVYIYEYIYVYETTLRRVDPHPRTPTDCV